MDGSARRCENRTADIRREPDCRTDDHDATQSSIPRLVTRLNSRVLWTNPLSTRFKLGSDSGG
jgi:hypothetical protein